MMFEIKDFSSKCDQIRIKLWKLFAVVQSKNLFYGVECNMLHKEEVSH